jgi:hypothetical protein
MLFQILVKLLGMTGGDGRGTGVLKGSDRRGPVRHEELIQRRIILLKVNGRFGTFRLYLQAR